MACSGVTAESEAYLSSECKHTFIGAAYFALVGKLLGDRIRERREELGMKPADLARAAGRSISAVMQWESNETKNLKLDNLFKIADALGVEPRWLATGDGIKLKKLDIAEGEAIVRLRDALPKWRAYVLSLAMTTDHKRQQLFLDMLSEHVPDETVAAAYGKPGEKKP
jgi:transcriptional regulator with XRE-family HTH domain